MPLDTAHNTMHLTSKQELWINTSLCIPSVQAMIFMAPFLTRALHFVILSHNSFAHFVLDMFSCDVCTMCMNLATFS